MQVTAIVCCGFRFSPVVPVSIQRLQVWFGVFTYFALLKNLAAQAIRITKKSRFGNNHICCGEPFCVDLDPWEVASSYRSSTVRSSTVRYSRLRGDLRATWCHGQISGRGSVKKLPATQGGIELKLILLSDVAFSEDSPTPQISANIDSHLLTSYG